MLCQDIDVVTFSFFPFFLISVWMMMTVFLITELSTISITSLMSWVSADEMTAESGIPSLSVKICLFVPSLLLSVGLFPVIAPLKAILWIYYRLIAMSS